MTDIDRLTIAIGCGFLLLIERLPENPVYKKWGLVHLTLDLVFKAILTLGIIIPIGYALGLQ